MSDDILTALGLDQYPTPAGKGKKKPAAKRGRGKPSNINLLIGDDDKKDVQLTGNWAEREAKAKVLKIEIENSIKLGDMIPKKMVQGILGQIHQGIKNQFVDLPRRESEVLAAKLGIPEKSRDLERLWSEQNSSALENMKAEVDALQKDEVYE